MSPHPPPPPTHTQCYIYIYIYIYIAILYAVSLRKGNQTAELGNETAK